MKMKLLYFALLLTLFLGVSSCAKIESLPDMAQPIIRRYSLPETVMVGNESIKLGPEKDYEQDSYVTFRLTVSSTSKLTKFFVTTSSDAKSSLSKVVKTDPENAIDAEGNFTSDLTNVVVYYAYHIDPVVPITAAGGSTVIVSFNFQNASNYTGTTSEEFSVIKKGSTNGKKLKVLSIAAADRYKNGIGSQRGLNTTFGYRPLGGFITNRSGLFSLEYGQDVWRYTDAVGAADKIDLIGYLAPAASVAGRVPAIVAGSWNFVSPSDTTVLGSKYAGATVARITLAGGGTTGGPHVLNITVAGVKKTITWSGASTTTTAAAFASAANKAAYLAAGVTLTNSAAVLTFTANSDNVGFDATKLEYVSGTMTAIDDYYSEPSTEMGNVFNPYYDMLYRRVFRDMGKELAKDGKKLLVAKFKRLDNVATADSVSLSYFDMLSHDNEFDSLLADCAVNGTTVSGPVALNQVWGFVFDDGRRGLIRTSPTVVPEDAAYTGANNVGTIVVTQPSGTPYTLWCTIKMSEKSE